MQEAIDIESLIFPREIAHAYSARRLATLALSALWLTAYATVPAAGSGCAAGEAKCASAAKPKAIVDTDEWKNVGDPRGLMVLIQSNLDRVAAGRPVWPAPKGVVPDARLQIVDAYADFMRGDFKGMDAAIAKAEQATVLFHWEWETPIQHDSSWRIGNIGYYKRFAASTHQLMALMQSALRRVAAGQPVWPTPKGTPAAARPSIAGYVLLDSLQGFSRDMDATVQAFGSPPPPVGLKRTKRAYDWKSGNSGFYKSFITASHDPSPLVRLYAALRDVDGSLFSTLGNPFDRTGPQTYVTPSPLDGTWVRLPCRTAIGRVPQFVAAADALKSLGGPVLDCPVDGPIDYVKDEALALHPERLSPHVTPPTTTNKAIVTSHDPALPAPSIRDAALAKMDAHPQQAAPILEHYSHVDVRGELDYALFLQVFEPQTLTRDATISALQSDLYKKALASSGMVSDFPLTPYSGADDSLLNIIRLASESGITNSAYYAIPCPFLIAHPALIAATQSYYGSNRDNFMPRSSCAANDFVRMGFPVKAVITFEAASTQADGSFVDSSQGSMVYGFETAQSSTNQQMRLNPRFFLNPDPPSFGYPSSSFEYPYQVWGYASLNNYVVSLRIRKLYLVAHDQLAAYYRKHMQLKRADSEQAAKIALFLATFGSNCGGDVPAVSLWRRLLKRAPPNEIKRLLNNGAAYAPEISACANYAGMDPLLLVAVADPAAFSVVMQHEPDINERNAIGKTALMEAAQFDQSGIADLLLKNHASVNATTWGSHDGFGPQLGNDARTALMYAAANGSLKLIKALLVAGADPYQADTKGYRAVDYLLGYGPTPLNPHLSERQRKRATQWLF